MSLALAVIVYAAVYVWNPPGPKYYPLLHDWAWQGPAGQPGMGWYARVAYAALAAGLAWGVAWAVLRRAALAERPAENLLVWTLSAAALGALAVAGICVIAEQFGN
ncbi:MAG: hypothetical protein HYZ00_13085 [Candidatus Hydrogenedentes bacterium]|nr:hypothetical protein [Candidatus Hydrogenedentota bacterium]